MGKGEVGGNDGKKNKSLVSGFKFLGKDQDHSTVLRQAQGKAGGRRQQSLKQPSSAA